MIEREFQEPGNSEIFYNIDFAAFKTDINKSLQIQRHLNTKQNMNNAINYLTRPINGVIDKNILITKTDKSDYHLRSPPSKDNVTRGDVDGNEILEKTIAARLIRYC